MQKNIFLYLFLFSALIALYLAVSSSKSLDKANQRVTDLRDEVSAYQDSLQAAKMRVSDMQYFSLENNDYALSHYDHLGLEDLPGYVADQLLDTNVQQGNNPLVPYEGMENDFKINKIKVVNHKWILADFSDGKYWGELFIGYEIREDGSVEFTRIDNLLYTNTD